MATRTKHPSAQQLADFGLGRTSPALSALIEAHIAECDECCAKLSDIPNDTLTDRLLQAETHPGGTSGTNASLPGAPPKAEVPPELAEHARYRVVRTLGVGGMGVVYQAEHRIMDRPVALKVIHRRLIDNHVAVQRFHLEVKAAARLQHPNIVTAFDAEQAGELHFLVMEFVDGQSLDQVVKRRGPFSIQQGCQCIRQAAIGLQHAFEKGMVHRDIKPQNLMLTRKGQLKILDFGLARFASEREAAAAPGEIGESAGLTMAGSVLGTPDYIAPEQVRDARQADTRADLYSLGCTLYFLLTGQPPFPRGTVRQKLTAHLDRDPSSILTLRADVPPEVVTILEKLLKKDPAERFQTPAELAQALAPLCKTVVTQPSPPTAAPVPEPVYEPVPDIPVVVASPSVHDRMIGNRAPQKRAMIPGGVWVWGLVGVLLVSASLALYWNPGAQAGAKGKEIKLAANGTGGAGQGTPDKQADASNSGAGKDSSLGSAEIQNRVLIVLPYLNFWYADFGPIQEKLDRNGYEVTVASTKLGEAQPHPQGGKFQVPVAVNKKLQDVHGGDYAATIFVGGDLSELQEFFPNGAAGQDVRRVIEEAQIQGRWVTSICAGNAVLASHDVLQNLDAANSEYLTPNIRQESGARWKEQPIVCGGKGKVITARDSQAAPEFAFTLYQKLQAERQQ